VKFSGEKNENKKTSKETSFMRGKRGRGDKSDLAKIKLNQQNRK
jgi:hypothetical protein